MAAKTPPGLGTVVGQTRTQYQRNWGNFVDDTTVPNGSAAALAPPGFSKLEVGDLCYVEGGANPGVYYCSSVGTVGGADAIWTLLAAGGAVIQTIRDSSAVVVGLSSAPYNNAMGKDADVLDPGNGTGLETALANAAALITGGYLGADVKIRAGAYTVDPAVVAVPLAIAKRVRVIGSGRDTTRITGGAGAAQSQQVFTLNLNTELKDLEILSPVPTGAPAAATGIVVMDGGLFQPSNITIRDVRFGLDGGGANARVTGSAIHVKGPVGNDVVVDACDFNLYSNATDIKAVAVTVGTKGSVSRPTVEPLIRDISVTDGLQAILINDCSGGRVHGLLFDAIDANAEGVVWEHTTNDSVGPVRGPTIIDLTLNMAADQPSLGGASRGIRVSSSGGNTVIGTQIHNVLVVWQPGFFGGTVFQTGVLLEALATSDFFFTTLLHGITVLGLPGSAPSYEQGLTLSADVPGAGFDSVSISDCQAVDAGDFGLVLDTATAAGGSIDDARVHGCAFKITNNGAATAAILIDTRCIGTIVLGNTLQYPQGTPVIDNGALSDIANNRLA